MQHLCRCVHTLAPQLPVILLGVKVLLDTGEKLAPQGTAHLDRGTLAPK